MAINLPGFNKAFERIIVPFIFFVNQVHGIENNIYGRPHHFSFMVNELNVDVRTAGVEIGKLVAFSFLFAHFGSFEIRRVYKGSPYSLENIQLLYVGQPLQQASLKQCSSK